MTFEDSVFLSVTTDRERFVLNAFFQKSNGFDINPNMSEIYVDNKLTYIACIQELLVVEKQNIIFLLLPAREPTKATMNDLEGIFKEADIVMDFYPEPGSGHYLKMVQNGIEYDMMLVIAEGLELLNTQKQFDFDLSQVTHNWSYGSIIESALMDNIHEDLAKDTQLTQFNQKVHASGEAKWMVGEALQEEIPTPVISLSLMKRNASLTELPFSNQVLSAMRYNFGGHKEY